MSSRTGIGGLILRLSIVAAITFPLSVFSKDNIQTYRIPKESPKKAMPAATSEPSKPKEKPLSWTLPEGWQETPASGVRVGSFIVPGKNGAQAEVLIMPFAGTVGGELSNVNRWRKEAGLEEIATNGIQSESAQVGSDSAKLYEIVGEKEEILVAWLIRDDTSWFFKMRGDKTAVSEAKPAFIEFLKSVRFLAAPSLEAANSVADNSMGNPHESTLPPGHPQMGVTQNELPTGHPNMEAADANPQSPEWQVPAQWKEQPASRMVLKSFMVGDESGKAVISISSFPGEVGGLLANVNRWRSQLGLDAITEADLPKLVQSIDTKNGKATLVQLDATAKPVRLVGIILPHGTDTWFYKMVGDIPVVAREKENLVNMVQSARYP